MNIDKKIEAFFNSTLESEIFEYFGFGGVWRELSLSDNREHFWSVDRDPCGAVYFSTEKFQDTYDALWNAPIIDKIYRQGKYVLIPHDTQCDGNAYAGLFLAANELTDLAKE